MTGQFRIAKLQVYNWGTFSGIHNIPIAEEGFLFVGRSGSGKTTLLDAFSALLIPPKWVDFNAAAHDRERGRDRNLLSYVRGAWAEQQDEDSGLIAMQFLRPGTTWSALGLTYRNDAGETVTLVQLFWIRGKSNSREDLHRYFLIFERPFDLRELDDFQLDVRRLKAKFPEAFAREDFSPYAERFCRRLGIDNELALKLLHKTQSAKNLGDLNTFLRDFMLDKPETFAAADRLVAEFSELNAAHQAVVEAREQIETLRPARDEYKSMQEVQARESGLGKLRASLDAYKQTLRLGLLEARIVQLEAERNARRADEQSRQAAFENDRALLEDLTAQRLAAGGRQIEDLQNEKRRTEELRDARLRKREEAQAACNKLGWELPAAPAEFAALTTAALREVETFPQWQEESGEKHARLAADQAALQREFQQIEEEVESLRRQPSNVPARMLKLRAGIAAELGVAETALPFAAELIEVLPKEAEWRGAIERALRGFALSLLVEERRYAAVSDLVNRASLGDRLTYNRVDREAAPVRRRAQPNSLARKVQVKEGPLAAYIENSLAERYDYACVDSMAAFRKTDFALTREGQIRHGKERHEKDDRFEIGDRSRWVLGFDNRAKLEIFEAKAQQAAAALDTCTRNLRALREADAQRAQRAFHCQTLAGIEWIEIDVASTLGRLAAIETTLRDLHEANTALRQIERRIDAQEKAAKKSEQALIETKGELSRVEKEKRTTMASFESLRERLQTVPIGEFESAGLSEYFNRAGHQFTLENLDSLSHQVDRALADEEKTLAVKRKELANSIEKRFAEFQRRWKLDASDVDATLNSASDYFARLKRLETDRLPDYEHRFFDLLRNQSHQNLAALATHISQARKTIYDRLEVVNESLRQAEFNQGTYLHIDPSDRNLEEVREFKQEIQQALSHAWTEDRAEAEQRFVVLRGLVERLRGEDPEQKRWRNAVLDVRQHVEFIGREFDGDERQVEVYRGGGGKSGGQREKLATTCLAAALRYQLGGDNCGVPQYAPVILDEAFEKADNEFTALAMKILTNFHFQMIVATPLKSVMTLEPFIGGACFVDIADRRRSGVLMIEYDRDRKRLDLPERVRQEAAAAVS